MTARSTRTTVLAPVAAGLLLLLCLRCADAFSPTTTTTTKTTMGAIARTPHAPRGGGFSSLSASASTSSTSSSSSSPGDGRGRRIDCGDVPPSHHQRRRREFVVRTIASAAAGIAMAIVPPLLLLDPAPALAEDDGEAAAASSSVVAIDPSVRLPRITHRAYLDVEFGSRGGGERKSRLVIGLFGDVMPRTVGNFLALCANRQGGGDAEGPSYVGSTFYRALSGNSIQGGAIGNPTGKTGTSSFANGSPFAPDNYDVRHTKAGLVSAVRANTNGDVDSRFFVQTEDDAGWADGRYAAFGIVLDVDDDDDGGGGGNYKGMDLVRRISRVEVKTPLNSPKDPITIVGCGVLAGA